MQNYVPSSKKRAASSRYQGTEPSTAKPGRWGVPLPGQGSEEEEEEKEEGEGGMEKEARRREEILSSFS